MLSEVLVTCSQVLEASESIVLMLLLVALLLVELTRARVSVFSILSSSSSKRITAITDNSFKDYKKDNKVVTSKSGKSLNESQNRSYKVGFILQNEPFW